MTLYIASVLESWSEDSPVTVVDACPAWYLDELSEHLADLMTVGLIDETGAVPEETLDRWMSGVRARSDAGRVGAQARWGRNGSGMRSHKGRNSPSNLPSNLPTEPNLPTDARDPKGSEKTGRSLKSIIAELTGEPSFVRKEEKG